MTTTALPESLISTLPGAYYTDPQIFALEQAEIFERMWFATVRGSDIPTPGSFRTVQVGTESVIVSRNRRGQARAFLNVCRHRGARVCDGETTGCRQTGVPVPVPRLDLRPGRQARRRAQSDEDAGHRPGRIRPARPAGP